MEVTGVLVGLSRRRKLEGQVGSEVKVGYIREWPVPAGVSTEREKYEGQAMVQDLRSEDREMPEAN